MPTINLKKKQVRLLPLKTAVEKKVKQYAKKYPAEKKDFKYHIDLKHRTRTEHSLLHEVNIFLVKKGLLEKEVFKIMFSKTQANPSDIIKEINIFLLKKHNGNKVETINYLEKNLKKTLSVVNKWRVEERLLHSTDVYDKFGILHQSQTNFLPIVLIYKDCIKELKSRPK